mgnify:CR=1 FL=1
MTTNASAAIKPLIFKKEIYASAAVLGGIVFASVVTISGSLFFAQLSGIHSTTLFRIIAVRYQLELPKLAPDK